MRVCGDEILDEFLERGVQRDGERGIVESATDEQYCCTSESWCWASAAFTGMIDATRAASSSNSFVNSSNVERTGRLRRDHYFLVLAIALAKASLTQRFRSWVSLKFVRRPEKSAWFFSYIAFSSPRSTAFFATSLVR